MTNSMKEDAPDYTGEASLRVYCEDADNTVVWVDQDGEYQEVESTVIGSYRQFTMEVPGSFRIAEAEGSHTRMIVIGIIGVAAVSYTHLRGIFTKLFQSCFITLCIIRYGDRNVTTAQIITA